MTIKELNGDLLGSTAPCICHQVNCKGAMGAGAARGGADWDVILAMIKSAFKGTDVTIEIWRLD